MTTCSSDTGLVHIVIRKFQKSLTSKENYKVQHLRKKKDCVQGCCRKGRSNVGPQLRVMDDVCVTRHISQTKAVRQSHNGHLTPQNRDSKIQCG